MTTVVNWCLGILIVYFTILLIDTQFAFLETVGLRILAISRGPAGGINWNKVGVYVLMAGAIVWVLSKG